MIDRVFIVSRFQAAKTVPRCCKCDCHQIKVRINVLDDGDA